jgi:hypothetical protein
MSKFHTLYISALIGFAPLQAYAGPVADAAVAAEKLADEGKFDDALAKINEAKDTIWDASPLIIHNATIVSADPAGYGIYDIRPNNEFKGDEKITIYSEPTGFAYGRDGDFYVVELALDFEIKDGSGASLAKQADFSKWTIRSRVPNKEFMGKLDYSFNGIKPGDYEVITTVRDKNADSSAEFSTKFKIVQ